VLAHRARRQAAQRRTRCEPVGRVDAGEQADPGPAECRRHVHQAAVGAEECVGIAQRQCRVEQAGLADEVAAALGHEGRRDRRHVDRRVVAAEQGVAQRRRVSRPLRREAFEQCVPVWIAAARIARAECHGDLEERRARARRSEVEARHERCAGCEAQHVAHAGIAEGGTRETLAHRAVEDGGERGPRPEPVLGLDGVRVDLVHQHQVVVGVAFLELAEDAAKAGAASEQRCQWLRDAQVHDRAGGDAGAGREIHHGVAERGPVEDPEQLVRRRRDAVDAHLRLASEKQSEIALHRMPQARAAGRRRQLGPLGSELVGHLGIERKAVRRVATAAPHAPGVHGVLRLPVSCRAAPDPSDRTRRSAASR